MVYAGKVIFQDNPDWYSNDSTNIFWESSTQTYSFKVNDDGKIYHGSSPAFQTIVNRSFGLSIDSSPNYGSWPQPILTILN